MRPFRPSSCSVVRRGVGLAATVASAAAALALLLPGPALPANANTHRALTSLESGVLEQINGIRAAHGLTPLQLNDRLTAAATAHCTQMVTYGFFGHQTAAGLSFAQRMAWYYPMGRSTYYDVGENLYWTSSSVDSSVVVAHWMRSAEHRMNILTPGWRQIGIAAVTVPSAPGVYAGLGVTVVAADFGVRR